MFSGSGYHSGMVPGNMSSMSRPGTGAGSTLQRGQGMRGSIDDLALMVAGAPQAHHQGHHQAHHQGTLLQQQQSYHQPGYPQQFQQQPQFQQQQQFQPHQQFHPQQQFQQQQSYADQSE